MIEILHLHPSKKEHHFQKEKIYNFLEYMFLIMKERIEYIDNRIGF